MTADGDLLGLARTRVQESIATFEAIDLDAVVRAAEAVVEAYRGGNKFILCGNGGSAADAQHIAAEFVGRFLKERRPLPALALNTNSSAVTAIGNDYGYADSFARQVRAQGVRGDVLMGLSTSGNSENVLQAVAAAQEIGMATIGFTGGSGGKLAEAVDHPVVIPSGSTPRIQEGHLVSAHVLCEIVESTLFPD
jgi:D-sedoheptulose 7-phosphate isomerase